MAKPPPQSRDRAGIAIGRRLQEVNLTQADLMRILKKSQSWISQVLLDQADKTLRRLYVNDPQLLARLLEVLNWTPDEFAVSTGLDFVAHVARSGPREAVVRADVIRIPFRGVGAAAAGTARDPDATIELPSKFARSGSALYFVHGNSMASTFEDGATLLVDETIRVTRNNGVYAIRLAGNGVQIRRCFVVAGQVMFVPDNADGAFPSYNQFDDDIEVLGQVYSILSAKPI